MAKRVSKAESTLFAALILIGLPIYLVAKLFEAVGWVVPALIVVAITAFVLWYQNDKKQKRLSYLRDKYQDEGIAQKILNGYFWQGQTEEQLRDSLGPPIEVDRNVMKTKTRELWKYQHQRSNHFRLRITVENGYVVGWDKKA